MTSRERLRKVAAQCSNCGAVYAAREWPDGSVQPIGQRDGCRCGCSAVEVVSAGGAGSP